MSSTTPYPASLITFAHDKQAVLEKRKQRRTLHDHARAADMQIISDGKALVSFCDNDYLGLSTDPQVIAAAVKATEAYGAGSGASRLVTGNHPLYARLESKIAAFKGTEAALVFGSGFLANCGIIPALAGEGDLILADELIHASLHGGCSLSRANTMFFRHNDCDHLAALLNQHRNQYRHVLILVDGIYSMDGDMAPLGCIAPLAQKYDAWLMVDDAHGFGVVGDGRGSANACGVSDQVPLQMGTLSKAAGAYGGYLAGPEVVIDLLKSRARSLVYTTGLPPGTVAAALEAITRISTDSALTQRPVQRARQFCMGLGLAPPISPIVPVIIGDEGACMGLSAALEDTGFKVSAIRPPTVPTGTSRLRFTFSATHSESMVDALIDACRDLGIQGYGHGGSQ